MDTFKKIEIGLLLIIIFFGIFLFFYLKSSGVISGFSVFEEKSNYPKNRISELNIIADSEQVIIKVDNPVLSRYDNSESMAPVIFNGATGVGIKPESESEIQVGDIISFFQDNKLIVHRVVEKGVDEQGVYFIAKGDNNNVDDNKIRFLDIDSVLVAVIY